jgi:hypothetical protein
MLEILTQILAGTVLGFIIGLTGVGGGVLTVPILIQIIRLEPICAVGTASFYVVLTKIYAVIKHYRQETINFQVGIKFLKSALPGVICSALVIKCTKTFMSSSEVQLLQNIISHLIIISIGFSLVVLLFDYSKAKTTFFSSGLGKVFRVLCIFFIGAIMGATSVGGGILIIPAILLFYRETSKYVGTSIFIAVLTMIVMSCIYAFIGQHTHSGDVAFNVAITMSIGSLFGTHYGSALSKKIPPRPLQFIVIAVIILAMVMMLVNKFNS